MNSLSFGSLTTPQSGLGMGLRMRSLTPRMMPRMRGMGLGVPKMGGLTAMKFAQGGYAEGGHPSMSWLAIRDALHSMPRHVVPDYMLARMADGGNVSITAARRAMREGYLPHAAGFPHMADGGDLLTQMRRRHGRLGSSRGIDFDTRPMRTTLQHDPYSWWDEGVPNRAALYRALGARRGIEMDPRIANEITQGAIDTVHGSPWRSALESTLGGSPADILSWSARRPLMGAAAALYSGEAAAPELRKRPYESYGRWQPFEGYD